MSMLIEGVDMPRGTNMMLLITPDGDVWEMGDLLGNDKLIDGAKAVPVPQHGRLVDARYIRDAIIQKWMDKAGDSHMYKCGMEDAYEVIRNAPTIIPAEGG